MTAAEGAARAGGAPGAAEYPLRPLQRLPYPVRNVVRRWRGALGMILGVGIALGVAMTIMAVSQATVEIYTADFKRTGANLYVMTQGGTLIPVLPSDTPGTIRHARGVLSQVQRWPEVSAAIGVMNGTLVRETEGRRGPDQPAELMAITGVEGDPSTISGMIDLSAGRWLRGPSEVVVGPRLSREKGLTPGQPLRLSGQTFTIVGTGKMRGLGYGTATDAVVYMDYQAFRQRADLGDVLNLILIQSTNPQAARQRVAELGNLASLTTADLVARAEEVNASSVGIYVVFIVLTLGVAALFVANMLARSVAERRLEFATLAAIGVPTRTILFTVGAEALAISLVASIFGMGLSLCLGALLNSLVAPQYSLETMYVAQPSLFGFVLFLAMVLGVLAGLLPARQATRVEPVEVLREA